MRNETRVIKVEEGPWAREGRSNNNTDLCIQFLEDSRAKAVALYDVSDSLMNTVTSAKQRVWCFGSPATVLTATGASPIKSKKVHGSPRKLRHTNLDLTMPFHSSHFCLARHNASHLNRTLLTAPYRQFATSQLLRSRLRQPGEPTGPDEPPSHTASPPSKSPLKVWPFVFIFATGAFLFKTIVDQRKGEYKPQGPVSGHSPSRP
ncbi:uncharacterized protein BDR25DRAFT_351343 [Lindgomyces ingoldianus]|uniref:Uncharacterized protein n=1 Tax=Lindgomyces ingoldianus TaxID=673940 RepID=A0ACB6R704_9PLEO|nr:uncharacterized protein BDR25DRAFT_351343 [Lindgomyces ingoldianus]KAF2474840.1 hypothetical protein BDR25DRAFT_351343 [Lindgomyces ingoldianus]